MRQERFCAPSLTDTGIPRARRNLDGRRARPCGVTRNLHLISALGTYLALVGSRPVGAVDTYPLAAHFASTSRLGLQSSN